MNTKKSKRKVDISFPNSPFFTIKDVFGLNKKSPLAEITQRCRLNDAVGNGDVVEIGFISGAMGRPEKIYTRSPVTETVMNMIEQAGHQLVDKAREKFGSAGSAGTTSFVPRLPVPVIN